MNTFVVSADDPESADVRALLEAHLAVARQFIPPDGVHALDVAGLRADGVSFFSARQNGELVAVGALKHLDPAHAELKSMHTAQAARGQGIGRAMLDHLVDTARARGYTRLSLETGSAPAFVPARALYESVGFEVCEPFGDYVPASYATCMTMELRAQA